MKIPKIITLTLIHTLLISTYIQAMQTNNQTSRSWAPSLIGTLATLGGLALTATTLHLRDKLKQQKDMNTYVIHKMVVLEHEKKELAKLTLCETDEWLVQNDKDNAMLTKILESKICPNFRCRSGKTPLMRAAQANNSRAIKLLLDHKANPSFKYKEQTALAMATDDEVIKTLTAAQAQHSSAAATTIDCCHKGAKSCVHETSTISLHNLLNDIDSDDEKNDEDEAKGPNNRIVTAQTPATSLAAAAAALDPQEIRDMAQFAFSDEAAPLRQQIGQALLPEINRFLMNTESNGSSTTPLLTCAKSNARASKEDEAKND
ncbi:MAG: ankyrin repeat domain-containing protein [Candidatus Dependentiae bacterium]|nr:ankyrin repeat domain-containing protein [Candidatus Dependentiae bacterium]